MQQQQQRRGLKANNNKTAGHVDLSPAAWSTQPQRRDGSAMRAVFLGDRTGKPRSTGTGVFLPRRVNHTDAESREKPSKVSMILSLIYFGSSHKFSDCVLFGVLALSTVLVPARVAEVLNLDESLVQQPVIRSSASLYGIYQTPNKPLG